MNRIIKFNPTEVGAWDSVMPPTQKDIINTKQLFQADIEFAWKHGGMFIRKFLDTLPNIAWGFEWIIDTKIHMLKPGWFPGIPGWHVDFAPNWEGIVDWTKVNLSEQHYCVITNDCSQTEFVAEPLELNVPDLPKINSYLSRQVHALYPDGIKTFKATPGMVYRFGQLHLHRVTAATKSGWRLFARASCTKLRKPLNEIRTQASQVYILAQDEHSGW